MPSLQWIYPAIAPADIVWMGRVYLTPLISPTPVATRLPNDSSANDTANGFVRLEEGGGNKNGYVAYDQTILCHTYVPWEFEAQGTAIANNVVGYMSAATGLSISGYYVVDVPSASAIARHTDPDVNLLRYLSFVTWTVAGHKLAGSN